jgi:hypothetical protein
MLKNGCETGCMRYTGGEIKHHPDCQHYPESLSKELDRLRKNERHYKDLWTCVTGLLHAIECEDEKLYRKKINGLKILTNFPECDL